MSVDVDDVSETIRQYAKHITSDGLVMGVDPAQDEAFSTIEKRYAEASEAEIGRALWQAFRRGAFDDWIPTYASTLAQYPGAYDADDVMEVLQAYAETYGPDGRAEFECPDGTIRLASPRDDRLSQIRVMTPAIEGYYEEMADLVSAKSDDEACLASLAERYHDLPSPYDQALAYILAQHGALEPEAIPEPFLERAAERYINAGGNWTEPRIPWPDAVWRQALLDAARDEDVTITHAAVVTDLAEHVGPDTLVDLLERSALSRGDSQWEAIDAVLEHGEAMQEPLETALRAAHEGEEKISRIPMLTYLELCRRLDQTVPERLDSVLVQFFSAFEPPSNIPHARTEKAVAVLSDDRLESLILAADELNLWAVGFAPTDAVFSRAEDKLRSEEPSKLRDKLKALGTDGIPLFRSLLDGDDIPGDHDLVLALTSIDDDAIVPCLVRALDHRRKTVRKPILRDLPEYDEDLVLEALPEALHGPRKHMRLGAAKVLADLPRSERRYELAQTQLEQERTDDVRAVLESIEPPTDSDFDEEAVRAQLNDDLSNWHRLADDVGSPLVHVLTDILDQQTDDYWWEDDDHRQRIYEVASYFADDPDMATRAAEVFIRAVHDPTRFGGPGYWREEWVELRDELHERVDGFAAALGERVVGYEEFGQFDYMTDEEVLEWICAEAAEESREVLIDALRDRRNSIRKRAQDHVASWDEETLLEIVPELLDADYKHTRLTAATLLSDLPPSERRYALAQKQLETERSAEVKDRLERIDPPPTGESA